MNIFSKSRRSVAAVSTVRIVGATLVACAMTATTFAAFAADRSEQPRQQTVRVGDLDLTKQADSERLYRRISFAARRVCENFDGRSLSEHALFTKCVGEATANTVAKLDLPALTQYANARTGQLLLTRAGLSDEHAILDK
jgi:UrcA family protein